MEKLKCTVYRTMMRLRGGGGIGNSSSTWQESPQQPVSREFGRRTVISQRANQSDNLTRRLVLGSRFRLRETPLIRLRQASEETGCEILGKAEYESTGGSIKDRAALYLVQKAEARGLLRPGGTVVEGTTGNAGIGLAHVCRDRGHRLVVYIPDTQAPRKAEVLRRLGAEVHAVPAVGHAHPRNYCNLAREHAVRLGNAVWTDQFDNLANRQSHFETTGPEIWSQTGGRVDAFTCATGTAGTLAGCTAYLKHVSNGRVKCFLADPPGSVLHTFVQTGKLTKRTGQSIVEGAGLGRVTANLASVVGQLDGSFTSSDEETVATFYRCFGDEGLFLGPSACLNVAAATQLARALGPSHTVVTILPDGGRRYANRLFSHKWLDSKNLLGAVPKPLTKYIALP